MSKKKILIIDDDEDFAKLIQMKLKQVGYEVYSAKDGQEGINKFKEVKPDLILLDIMMPQVNGFEVLFILRNEYPKAKHLPILMLTIRDEMEAIFKAKGFGATDYLSKSVDTEEVLKRIAKALSESKKEVG